MSEPKRSRGAAAPGDPEDAALASRAAGGDGDALRALWERHRHAVRRLALSFFPLDPDEADDVVQDAFVRAFGNLPKLAQPGRFGPWLLTIARNRALTRLGRRRTAERAAEDLGREAEAWAGDAAGLPDLGAEAELELVRKIVAELPDGPEKETVRLFYLEGELSAREIAARLGVGKSAITMRLERFRAKVKRRILAEVARLRGEES